MSDEITHRLSAEGVDPLALAGVNDANLLELAQRLGVRVSLRGDTLTLQGALPAVERAAQVAQALVDLARMGETLEVGEDAPLHRRIGDADGPRAELVAVVHGVVVQRAAAQGIAVEPAHIVRMG